MHTFTREEINNKIYPVNFLQELKLTGGTSAILGAVIFVVVAALVVLAIVIYLKRKGHTLSSVKESLVSPFSITC